MDKIFKEIMLLSYAKNKKTILALIPARSGSNSIKNKNIKIYKGKPLLAHSILIAKRSSFIDKIIVSTDSKNIKKFQKNLEQKSLFKTKENKL